jgi:hypothetical protein
MSLAQGFKKLEVGVTPALTGTTAVVITDASLTANSVVLLSLKTAGAGAGVGQAYVSAVSIPALPALPTFSVASPAPDTSVYNYIIFN